MAKEPKKWIDYKGQEVPAKYVPEIDKKKERIIDRYLKKSIDLNKMLIAFKQEFLCDCDNINVERMMEANIALADRKGNYTLTSFDKSIKIEVNIQDRIEFDDNINFAQEKIKEFLTEKTLNSDPELAEIVNTAFQTSRGKLDNKRILGLFRLKIQHPVWLEAMELIKKSIQTNSSTRYITIWQKNEEGSYKQIQLNFSAL